MNRCTGCGDYHILHIHQEQCEGAVSEDLTPAEMRDVERNVEG